jgi:hypothetical protein
VEIPHGDGVMDLVPLIYDEKVFFHSDFAERDFGNC